MFSLLLDLDELPALSGRSACSASNARASSASAKPTTATADAAPRSGPRRCSRDAGIAFDGGRIELLCYPRIFGFVFNPLSVYFCRNRDGELARHPLRSPQHARRAPHLCDARRAAAAGGAARGARRSSSSRRSCRWIAPTASASRRPAERVGVSILEDDAEGLLLTARFTGTRRGALATRRSGACSAALSADDAEGRCRHPLGSDQAAAQGRAAHRLVAGARSGSPRAAKILRSRGVDAAERQAAPHEPYSMI